MISMILIFLNAQLFFFLDKADKADCALPRRFSRYGSLSLTRIITRLTRFTGRHTKIYIFEPDILFIPNFTNFTSYIIYTEI